MLHCLFGKERGRYALAARCVREIIPHVAVHAFAGAPAEVCGSVRYRGRWIPVVDASLSLEGRPSEDAMATRILVLVCPGSGRETEPPRATDGEDPETGQPPPSSGEAGNRSTDGDMQTDVVGLLVEGVTEVVPLPQMEPGAGEPSTMPGRDSDANPIRPLRVATLADGTPVQCLRMEDLIPVSLLKASTGAADGGAA